MKTEKKEITIDDILSTEKEVQKMTPKKRHYTKRAKPKKRFVILLEDDLFDEMQKMLDEAGLSRSEFFKKSVLDAMKRKVSGEAPIPEKSGAEKLEELLSKKEVVEKIGKLNIDFLLEVANKKEKNSKEGKATKKTKRG